MRPSAFALFALLAGCTPTAPEQGAETDAAPQVETPAPPVGSEVDQAKALLTLGLARLHTGDNEQAATVFSDLAALAPDSPTATYNLALAQYPAGTRQQE